MPFSSSNTGSTDLRLTEVQQPNTTGDLFLLQQLARLLGEQRPVRCRVDHDRLQLLAEQAALLVLLVDQHQHDVLQRRLADRHRARQRMQHADLDAVSDGFAENAKVKDGRSPMSRVQSAQARGLPS
jgi:hypothetical protein